MSDMPFSRIEIQDDFINVQDDDVQRLFRGQSWSFGWKSNSQRDAHSFWHRHFIENGPKAKDEDRARYSAERYPAVQRVWEKVVERTGIESSKLTLQRAYANGLTFGLEGRIHTDSQNHRDATALIYVNPFWVPAWAAETVFMKDEETICVSPSPGRLVLFNGTIRHVARAPSRDCPALRMTLMFKFRIEGQK